MLEKEIVEINHAIWRGLRRVLPARLLSRKYQGTDPVTGKEIYSETQIADDIRQSVWVKLLETGDLTTKRANSEARSHARDWQRREFKTMAVSQMTLPLADPGDADSEGLMPWDWVDLSKPTQFDEETFKFFDNQEDDERDRILRELPQRDRRFLARYVSKKVRHSPANWKRFQRLTERMKKSIKFLGQECPQNGDI